jgi:hypothetical protein
VFRMFSLKSVLKTEIDGKRMHEHIKGILGTLQTSDTTSTELTKILQNAGLN